MTVGMTIIERGEKGVNAAAGDLLEGVLTSRIIDGVSGES